MSRFDELQLNRISLVKKYEDLKHYFIGHHPSEVASEILEGIERELRRLCRPYKRESVLRVDAELCAQVSNAADFQKWVKKMNVLEL